MNDQFTWWVVALVLVLGAALVWVALGPVPDDEPAADEPEAPLPRTAGPSIPRGADGRPYAGALRPYEVPEVASRRPRPAPGTEPVAAPDDAPEDVGAEGVAGVGTANADVGTASPDPEPVEEPGAGEAPRPGEVVGSLEEVGDPVAPDDRRAEIDDRGGGI